MKSTIQSTCIPLPIENIDTDQIIPARFLKAITREGFGENLFRDWRSKEKNFVLNDPVHKGRILVAGRNFGCGSSREHVAWALLDYGFQAVISSFFADIFKNNALINGLLPIQVSDFFLAELLATIKKRPKTVVTINIEKQSITVGKHREKFLLDPYRKTCLLKGYNDVDYIRSLKKEIALFEEKRTNDFSI